MHIFKKIKCIIFQNFSENVINDLYSLCFQNNCTSLNYSFIKEELKLHHMKEVNMCK